MNSSSHLLKTSQGESGREAEVEVTGATRPRIGGHSKTESASRDETCVWRKSNPLGWSCGEGGEGAEPGKPLRRIGDEREHALRGRNDHDAPIGANLDEWQSTRTPPSRLWFRLDRARCRCLDTSRTSNLGWNGSAGWYRGSKHRHSRGGKLVGEALAQER
jgi:hypothetical protein